MSKKKCFFIGHRDAGSEMLPSLIDAVEKHITQLGVRVFIIGNYGGFDRIAARAVCMAKERHPDVELLQLLPYHPAERPLELPSGFDGSLYPDRMENVPRRLAIVRANHYAVDHSDYLIAYVWHPASNSLNLVEYAQAREKRGLISITLLPKP